MFGHLSSPSRVLRSSSVCLSLLGCLALSACGGGGGGDSPALTPPPAVNQGVYVGTTSNTSAPDFQMLVLEDGEVWAIYGTQSSGTFFVESFVQGQASFSNGQISASNIRDHGFLPAVSGSLSGTYTSDPAVAGQITYGSSGTVTFSANGMTESTYDYQVPAQLSEISGGWSTSLTTGETASLTISNTGAVGGVSSSGCSFTGQVDPSASGKNVFDVRLTFTSSQCALQGQTATGIGLTYVTTSGPRQLIVLVQNSARTAGVAAFGTR